MVYLANTLDDLGEFVLDFKQKVEELLGKLCDETYKNQQVQTSVSYEAISLLSSQTSTLKA